jgi:DNA-binding NarL/FixJ family response regulator
VLEELRAASRPDLTTQQWRILAALATGSDIRAIAVEVGLSEDGVRYHLAELYPRLPLGDVTNRRVAAVLWYLREGHRYHEEAE